MLDPAIAKTLQITHRAAPLDGTWLLEEENSFGAADWGSHTVIRGNSGQFFAGKNQIGSYLFENLGLNTSNNFTGRRALLPLMSSIESTTKP